jgi:25S rRNA (uracil2634-N3)-methyltransferase
MGGKKRKLAHKPPPSTHQKKHIQHGKSVQKIPVPQKPVNGPAKKGKSKQQRPVVDTPTIPFEPHHRILLIGEGDLSFAASIIQHHGCANVTATVLEKDADELLAKYPHVEDNIAVIRGDAPKTKKVEGDVQGVSTEETEGGESKNDGQDENEDSNGVSDNDEDDYYDSDDPDAPARPKRNLPPNNKLLYNIDATKLPNSITRTPFDRIIFNFPHVGGKSTDVNRQVRHNQSLLVSFFERAIPALAPGAAIVITLFEGEPYTLWNVRDLARHAGLQVERSFRFQARGYPGFKHARTLGVVRNATGEVSESGWKGEERASRSFVFKRKEDIASVVGKKRRKGEDSSDDED